MVEPIENLYFNWLCAKIYFNENQSPSNTYWVLLRTLQNTEFVWLLSGDDNRAEDGLELRMEFLFELDIPDHPEWRRNPGCSMFEMLIAFSRRAQFTTGTSSRDWFWEFLTNLGLNEFDDASHVRSFEMDNILEKFIWRTYEPNGNGGLFPLSKPKEDQRKVEIWYQFCNYLVDQDRLP